MSKISFKEAKFLTLKVFKSSASVAMTKFPLDNIVLGKLEEIPLLEMLINLNIVTKEHVDGTTYDKHTFQMVMRIIGGKLFMRGQELVERPDVHMPGVLPRYLTPRIRKIRTLTIVVIVRAHFYFWLRRQDSNLRPSGDTELVFCIFCIFHILRMCCPVRV